jgi:hypothetical protein
MNRVAVCVSTDILYLQYTDNLLHSAVNYCPEMDIYCRLILSTDDHYDCRNDRISIIRDNTNLCSKKKLCKTTSSDLYYGYNGSLKTITGLKNIRNTLYSLRAVYSCHSRFKTIHELMLRGYEYIITLDADSIIVDQFTDDLITAMQNYDMGVVPYLDDDGSVFPFRNEGFLVFCNNSTTQSKVKSINNYLFTDGHYKHWDADTTALEHHCSDLKVLYLDEKFKDHQHKPNSKIWAGGENKYNDIFTEYRQQLTSDMILINAHM